MWILITYVAAIIPVAVGVLPRFEVPVVNVTVVEGTTAILPCSVNNLGRHQVVWTDQWATILAFKDSRIIDDDRFSIQRPFDSNWNLHIHGVKHGDQGQFICQVNTTPVQKQTVVLNVLVPPRIVGNNLANRYIVKEGMSVALICNVTGIPPATVTWYKLPMDIGNKKESEFCVQTTRIGFSGEILKIHNVTRYCSGSYECVADNGVPPQFTREMEVAIEFAPEIRLPNRRIGQVQKKETILDCVVTAYPQAVSVWKFKGRELSKSSKHNVEVFNEGDHKITLSLRIKNIGKEDYGMYTCVASNSMGKTSKRMELYEHIIPTTPAPTTPTTTTFASTTKLSQPGKSSRIGQYGDEVLEPNIILKSKRPQTSRDSQSKSKRPLIGSRSGSARPSSPWSFQHSSSLALASAISLLTALYIPCIHSL